MALNLPKTASSDERHTEWVRVVERIYEEQMNQGWRHKMFRLARAVFTTNPDLSEEGGFLFNWMALNYVDASLMVVRREMDVQSGTENLRNLLEDIIKHPEVLTRARYVALWQVGEANQAKEAFDSFNPVTVPDRPEEDYIDPRVVQSDLDKVDKDAERLRVYAERTRAHRTRKKGVDTSVTFRDLHGAIEDIRGIVGKYYTLLTLKMVVDWEPVDPYNTIAPFTKPWVTDPAAVVRAADEEPK